MAWTYFTAQSSAATGAQVKGSAGSVSYYEGANGAAVAAYLQLYDSAGALSNGLVPVYSSASVAVNAFVQITLPVGGIAFKNGIYVVWSTTLPTLTGHSNVFYLSVNYN